MGTIDGARKESAPRIARGRTERGLRENRENVEESLLSSAIRLPCKRAVYVAGDLVAQLPKGFVDFSSTPTWGASLRFENINLIKG